MAEKSVWELVLMEEIKLGLGFLVLALASSFMFFWYGILISFFNLLYVRLISIYTPTFLQLCHWIQFYHSLDNSLYTAHPYHYVYTTQLHYPTFTFLLFFLFYIYLFIKYGK